MKSVLISEETARIVIDRIETLDDDDVLLVEITRGQANVRELMMLLLSHVC